VTIIAGVHVHGREASCSTFLRAALVDAANAVDYIILKVPGPVELLVTDWRRARVTAANLRNLVVNVQMLSAAHFAIARHTTTVTGHDIISIGIALVLAIPKKVLANTHALRMVVN